MKLKLKSIQGLPLIVIFLSTTFVFSAHALESWTGTEDNIIDITPIKSASIITFSYTGEGVFSASPVDETGKEGFFYQLQIGDFTGTYFQGAPSKPIVAMAVKGIGEWEIVIDSLKAATRSGAKSGTGSGTTVINLGKPTTKINRITWLHNGDGVFVVTPIDARGKSRFPLFLKIGSYSGTVSLLKGTQYFEIKADGEWKYSIK
jgi:hypothetical protein